MREIKFRAWSKKDKQMHYSDKMFLSVTFPKRFDENEYEEGRVYLDAKFWNELMHTFDVMQYTGLKDKNGKEIYEGDIVNSGNLRRSKDDQWVKAVVEWGAHYWAITSVAKKSQTGLAIPHDKKFGVEIIGNIYENPELLKE